MKDSEEAKGFDGGISHSAIREIAILREFQHVNIVKMQNIYVDPQERSFYMVLDYAEYDLHRIIQYHKNNGTVLSMYSIKSYMWQLLNGISFLHENWIIHRDIKPSNILVMGEGKEVGVVKIGDFGLARVFKEPLRPLADNGVVVTLWYRAPELLLGTKHYTVAVDLWAIGCIFAELITTKPLFHIRVNKSSNNANPGVNKEAMDQIMKIFYILGIPTEREWPELDSLPDWTKAMKYRESTHNVNPTPSDSAATTSQLKNYVPSLSLDSSAFDLLQKLVIYDPSRRINAKDALDHSYFKEAPFASTNAFYPPGTSRSSTKLPYPIRRPS
eukprot:TRINITY_DN7989_c0_g1_i1.p1 TRINITY_DN7989_c0_g1~~TRINITY_DN7989_c0_g1_i1.p1  ORF type:complete len:376 (+),score=49.28 TRINITY_DN7989_c0_g1_i1:142-1128(+)